MKAYGLSHNGKTREKNQDAFFLQTDSIGSLKNLYIVADGMGGHLAGEIASANAIEAFKDFVKTTTDVNENWLDILVEATQYSNSTIYRQSKENPEYRGMGTTFTAMTIAKGKAYVSHIGDSRVYKINTFSIAQVTQDHSYVEELVRRGEISIKDAENHPSKHILTRVLGSDKKSNIDAIVFDVKEGDKILMCTDGLTNMISDFAIEKIITQNTVEFAVKNLIMSANANGGTDNITCLLIEIVGEKDAS